MLRYLKQLPISTRLWLLVVSFSCAVFANQAIELLSHEQRLRSEKEQQLHEQVETAHSLLQHFDSEAKSGRLSESEAREQAIRAIRPLRYSEKEYFWIHELSHPIPRMVMHPTSPELEGRILDHPDFLRANASRHGLTGRYSERFNDNLFAAMNDATDNADGDGFVAYDWPKPMIGGGTSNQSYPKLSFVKRFKPWGWVIGSGMYMDEFEASYWREVKSKLSISAIWTALFLILSWLVLRTIIQPLQGLKDSIELLRKNPGKIVDFPADQPQELGLVAQSFHSLMIELQQSRRSLQASLDDLRLAGCAVERMSEGVMVTDHEQRIVSINPAFTRINGYTEVEAIGAFASMLKSGRHNEVFYQAMWSALNTTGNWSGEIWNRAKDGRIYPEWLSISTSYSKQGGVLNYVGVFSDITERKHSEANMRIAATAFESQEGMFITDGHGIILRVNKAFTDITGYNAEEAIGKAPGILRSGRHDADFYQNMRTSIDETGTWQGEIWNRRKNGEIFPEWLTITSVKDNTGQVTHHVSTLTDITQRKASENEIKHLAFYDPLTQLPNRRLLLDRLQHSISASARTKKHGALMFIDLDNFKTLNDTLGHDKGDLLLQAVARRLTSNVREDDTVARLGGDEFVVMLEGLSVERDEAAQQTDAIGEKILSSLNQAYDLAGVAYYNTPSIGITLFSDQQTSIDDLLKRADLAMYQAKAAGRNTLRFFDPEMQKSINAQLTLEAEFRDAVRLKQFILNYQAQVNATGKTISAEALVRWQHPERGIVSPGEFIPLAEKTGLILPLGEWILETACQQLATWSAEPSHSALFLSVNISAVQYHQNDFVTQVKSIIEKTGANPKKLKLELTESLMLDDIDEVISKMNQLKAIGIGFSLDDFGTGYSSLSYLKRLPVEQLKIDRSFVQDLLDNPSDKAFIKTILALASSMDINVIAEGVETEAQQQCLAEMGCIQYQGFLFSRPGTIEQLTAKMQP
jgi:diguanylate cyclase (GGDEF)-like protein/PAS domain S-box-containing protein